MFARGVPDVQSVENDHGHREVDMNIIYRLNADTVTFRHSMHAALKVRFSLSRVSILSPSCCYSISEQTHIAPAFVLGKEVGHQH